MLVPPLAHGRLLCGSCDQRVVSSAASQPAQCEPAEHSCKQALANTAHGAMSFCGIC